MGLQELLNQLCILICGLAVGYGVDLDSKKQMTRTSGCGLVLKTRVVGHADTAVWEQLVLYHERDYQGVFLPFFLLLFLLLLF